MVSEGPRSATRRAGDRPEQQRLAGSQRHRPEPDDQFVEQTLVERVAFLVA